MEQKWSTIEQEAIKKHSDTIMVKFFDALKKIQLSIFLYF